MPAAPGLSTVGYAPLALATLDAFGDREALTWMKPVARTFGGDCIREQARRRVSVRIRIRSTGLEVNHSDARRELTSGRRASAKNLTLGALPGPSGRKPAL